MNRSTVITLILAAALSAITASVVANYAAVPEYEESQSRYEQIVDTGVLRAGYFVGAPYFVKDPNTGAISGIFADVSQAVAANLGLRIEWAEEVGFGQMAAVLNSGRVDVVASGIWINANRARQADFTMPVLYDAVAAFVRSDDKRFDDNLEAINDPSIRISTIDGEMAASIAATDFSQAQIISLPQLSDFTQMIMNVTNDKADVTFLGVAPARKYMAANPNSIRNITPEKPVRIFPAAIMVPRGSYGLKRALDLAILEMQLDGRIESIIQEYEEFAGSHYRTAFPYRAPAPETAH